MNLNYIKDKKNLAITILALLIIIALIFAWFLFRKNKQNETGGTNLKNFKGQIINDTIKIPDTVSVDSNEGEIVPRGEYNVKLQPQSESDQVVISKAKLTLKEAYNMAVVEAAKWSDDQKLVFIKSNGAIGLDGRSSSWQLVYGSAKKNLTYEIIISSDQIVSAKEINSVVKGFDLPVNWYDSYEAIASLRNLPQFSNDTISAISFYYSGAEASWVYGIADGNKTTAMWVK